MGPGTRIAHFEVLGLVGTGGMGEVYRARDLRLGRDVAIKVLPAELASDPERLRRFEQEARAVAALNHPNILALHDVGTHEGAPYIVTELLEGHSLQERLRAGPLPPRRAIEAAVQIAQGLAAAHAKGIVHRDLKPGNVFVSEDGHVKILDFGIAKLAGAPTQEGALAATVADATRTGTTLGTVGYMSPEQVRGQPVDQRSDIFSFGVVLYEMLAGSRPFHGDTNADTASAILREDPKPLSESVPMVAPALQEIVARCLEKRAQERFSSAHDLALALRALSGTGAVSAAEPVARSRMRPVVVGAALAAVVGLVVALALWQPWKGAGRAAATAHAVAVLPFASFSAAGEEYLAEGMQDAVIAALARVGELRVISRTSASAFKGTSKSAVEIARALKADELVEGSVQHAGGRLRVQLKLIRTDPEERQVWAETYDREMSDVFVLYRDIAAAVATQIDPRLAASAATASKPARKVNPEVYQLYLKAMSQLQKGTEEDYKRGIALLREASGREPSDALPYAGIAKAYAMLAHSPAGSPEVLEIAKASARKALAIDPELPEAYAALALIKQYDDWDWNGLEQDFRTALELNPTDAELRRHYAWYLMLFKRPDEALAELRRARADDPLGGVYYSDLGMQLIILGRDDEALAEARRGVELEPENYNNLYGLGAVYRRKGMLDQAIAVDRTLVKVEPLFKWTLAYSLALAGRGVEAQPIVDELRKATDSWSAYGLAHIYVAKGDKDEALRWLEIARQRRCVWVPWVGVGAELAPLRGDPRFAKVLAAIGVPNVEPGFGRPKT